MLIIRPNTTHRSSTSLLLCTTTCSVIHICHHQVGVGSIIIRNIEGKTSLLHSTLLRNTHRDDVNQHRTWFCLSRYYQRLSMAQINPFRPCLSHYATQSVSSRFSAKIFSPSAFAAGHDFVFFLPGSEPVLDGPVITMRYNT